MKVDSSGKKSGQSAKPIKIKLTEQEGQISIAGSHVGIMPKEGRLNLLARGMDGRDGKKGQDGADGANGRAGDDATDCQEGTNGGRGKNGQDGEPGTHGQNAGNGGDIIVTVDERDVALLDAIGEVNYSAGVPGAPGRHGQGGTGGKGGKGGKDYSWTTYETTCETVRQDGHEVTVRRETPKHHYHQGGRDGADGLDGNTPSFPLHSGKPGKDGVYQIHVQGTGLTVHSEPYRLALEPIRIDSTEGGGIFEPGDSLSVIYRVSNIAPSMASPYEDTPLLVTANEKFVSKGPGQVPGFIAAGSFVDSDQAPVTFTLKLPSREASETPFKDTVSVEVCALNTRLNKAFKNATHTQDIEVRYPIELMPAPIHFSIAEGETVQLPAEIINVSSKALGNKEGRRVKVRISSDGQNHFQDFELESLAGGKTSTECHSQVGFMDDAPLGTRGNYLVDVYLQPLDRSKELTLIQRQPVSVQLTPKYSPSKGGFTLVINSRTTQAAIDYWTQFLSDLSGGQAVGVWNTSYYQRFPIDGEEDSLFNDLSHGTMVVLDNEYSRDETHAPCHDSEVITEAHLHRATRIHDASMVVVGDGAYQRNEKPNKEHIIWPEGAMTHDSISDCVHYLLANNHAQMVGEEDHLTDVSHEMVLNVQGLFKSSNYASQQASQLSNRLQEALPNRNFHVALEPMEDHPHQVKLKVLQLAARLDARLKTASSHEHEGQRHELIEALPFTQKLKLVMSHEGVYQRAMATSLAKDLLAEQSSLLDAKTYGSWWELLIRRYRHDFRQELTRLSQLASHLNTLATEQPEVAKRFAPQVIHLIAQVQYHAQQHDSFWLTLKHFFFPQAKKAMLKQTKSMCDELLSLQARVLDLSADSVKKSTCEEVDSIGTFHKVIPSLCFGACLFKPVLPARPAGLAPELALEL